MRENAALAGFGNSGADNASCGLFVPGAAAVAPAAVDLAACGMVHEKNGAAATTGAAALGSPVNCAARRVNALGAPGIKPAAGEVVLSGSLAPLRPPAPGDSMNPAGGGIGPAAVRFSRAGAAGEV